nr:unnamed protein product [Spirometra erinaceieuropaei]
MPNRQPLNVHDANGHFERQLDLLNTSGPTAAPGLNQPSSLLPPLHRLPRRQLTLTALPKHHYIPSFASASAAVASVMPLNTTHDPDTSTNTNYESLVYTCPHCDCAFTSHIGLVSHLRIHRTATGEPVPGTPTYTRRARLHCPHCPRTFLHHMGLFGHICIHESGIDHSPDTPSPCGTLTMPSPTHTAA